MSSKRKAVLAGIALLFAVTVLTGNLLIVAERTALNPEFAKTTVEEEGVHERFAEDLRENVGNDAVPVEEVLTDDYVRAQIHANVDRFYGYLHGEREELRLYFELAPVKEELAREMAAEHDDVDRETARAELDEEMPDTHDFTEGMDEEGASTLETARTVVSVIDALSLVVPLFGLAIAGGFLHVASDRGLAASVIGAAIAVVGLLGAVVSSVAPGQVRSLIGGASSADQGAAMLLSVTGRIASVLLEQSLVLLLLGLAIVAIGIGMRRELLPAEWT